MLVTVAFGYTGWMIRSARSGAALAAHADAAAARDAADVAGAPRPVSAWRSAATAAFGLGVLLVGGDLFIDGAVAVARTLGMSDRLVGLTVVAVGTSLPELVTSVIAARRGHSDLAVGNVVGSNIFNVLLCLGAAALVGTVATPFRVVAFDVVALLVMTATAAIFIRSARSISRVEGALAVGVYVILTVVTVARG